MYRIMMARNGRYYVQKFNYRRDQWLMIGNFFRSLCEARAYANRRKCAGQIAAGLVEYV